jgi:hypothetical protein
MKILIICLLLIVVNCEINKEFPKYGEYCGWGHTNYFGKEPIDKLDRFCQIHDICVTLDEHGITSCWCHEQLYYFLSNWKPYNKETTKRKNDILYYMYILIARCENHYHFDTNIHITKAITINGINSTKGFNYLPFYKNDTNSSFIIKSNGTILLFKLNEKQYNKFTYDAYIKPTEVKIIYTEYLIAIIKRNVEYNLCITNNQNYVIYNDDIDYSRIIKIYNKTHIIKCEEQEQEQESKIYLVIFFLSILIGMMISLVFFNILQYYQKEIYCCNGQQSSLSINCINRNSSPNYLSNYLSY